MRIEYDRRVDAAYFSFSTAASARQEKLDDARILDYDADGTVVGVEFITPSLGLDLNAYPSVDNPPSNAIGRKVGFTLLGDYEFEYRPATSCGATTGGSICSRTA